MVTKNTLRQYTEIQDEIQKIMVEIKKTEDSLEELVRVGTVRDHVRGGLGGWEGFSIEGFPIRQYERRVELLKSKYARLREKENDLLEVTEEIERYIDSIPNSRDRKVFKRYFLNNETQKEIASEMYIDRSLVSKILSRYL